MVIGGFLTALYLIVGVKAFYLQVIADDMLSARASGQYRQSMECRGKRGAIFDASHRELAISTSVVEVGVHPKELIAKNVNTPPDKRELARKVSQILNQDEGVIYRKLCENKNFVWIDRKVTPERATALKSLGLAGFEYFPSFLRVYPCKSLAAQLIGFVGIDGNGLDGLEQHYDNELQGTPQEWTIIKDRMGRIFDRQETCCMPGYEGKNLVLTIDSTIQYIAETALARSVEENNAKSGIAIVMAPATGAVKAMAHYPTFNPNAFTRFPKETWRNRAVTDTFEPGSVLKVFLMAAALESGVCDPETLINCENGAYRIGRNTVNDTHDYDFLTVHDVLKYSSNIGAVKIAEMMGPEVLYETLLNFGFGETTGINCPGEVRGLMRNYQGWKPIDYATISFGQGLTVTPIQLIAAISAVANQGVLMTPYVVQAITDENGNIIKSFQPARKRSVIMPEIADVLMTMMNAVTEADGTGGLAVPAGYTVCGKTGTAQKINKDGTYRNCEYNGVFVGFSPARNPELAVLVVIDEPQKNHYGGIVAAPVFREIVHEAFNYMNIPPCIFNTPLKVSRELAETGA
jgi:cell division protein FtsI (penicillin-binding protein 3)